jgi:hypothetical protein
MSNRSFHRLVRDLKKQAEDPDYHPAIRQLFREAAEAIETLADDIEARIREGSDHD